MDSLRHMSYIERQRNPKAYGHHEVKSGTTRCVIYCNICGRAVIRGYGRWWE